MIEVAEVVSVSYQDENVEGLWQVRCRLLSDTAAKTKDYAPIIARPINTVVKQLPLPGELVLITKATTNIASKNVNIQEYYYLQTLNVQSSMHHNALITVGDVESGGASSGDYQTSTSATNKTSKDKTNLIGDFDENDEVRPLQPYEGDILIEGRHGQSIRMGSTITKGNEKYAIEDPEWLTGKSKHGDPITVIRNGQKSQFSLKPNKNQYISENIDQDGALIYLTAGQEVPFSRGSEDLNAHNELKFEKEKYDGNQVIISSDRLIFNAREKETLFYSVGGIGLSSPGGITLDSSKGIHLSSKVINLGNKAKDDGEPGVLGDTTNERLDAIVDYVIAVCAEIAKIIVPTGVGPSGVPTNAALFTGKFKADGEKLKQKHPDIKSKLVFLLKDKEYTRTQKRSERKKNR